MKNPVKICPGTGAIPRTPRFYPAEHVACPICGRTFIGLPAGYPIPTHRPYKGAKNPGTRKSSSKPKSMTKSLLPLAVIGGLVWLLLKNR